MRRTAQSRTPGVAAMRAFWADKSTLYVCVPGATAAAAATGFKSGPRMSADIDIVRTRDIAP